MEPIKGTQRVKIFHADNSTELEEDINSYLTDRPISTLMKIEFTTGIDIAGKMYFAVFLYYLK